MTDNVGSRILQLAKNGGHLLNPAKLTDRIWIPAKLIREYRLSQGATIRGQVPSGQEGHQLATVEAVCGPPQLKSGAGFAQSLLC